MKKKIIIVSVFLLLVFAAGFVTWGGGGKLTLPWETEESRLILEEGDVKLSIIENSLKKTGAGLKILNDGPEQIFFGQEYFLQLKQGGEWLDIKVSKGDFTAELNFVKPKTSFRTEVDWENIYGVLPSGEYRIVKEYVMGSEEGYMFCEFRIFS